MVDPSVQGAIPLYVARAQCSFLADETMEVKEDGGEGRRRRKARRRRARRRGSFCSHLESAQLDAVCHFFTFLPSPFRAPLSSRPFSPFLFVSPSFPVRVSHPVALSSLPFATSSSLPVFPSLFLPLSLSLRPGVSSSTADALCLGETRLETPRGAILRRFRPLPS